MQFTWELIQYARYHTAARSPRRTAPSPIRSSRREAARRAEIAMTGIPITMNSTRLTTKKAQILLNTFCVNTSCNLLSISCIAWYLNVHTFHDAGRRGGPSPHLECHATSSGRLTSVRKRLLARMTPELSDPPRPGEQPVDEQHDDCP